MEKHQFNDHLEFMVEDHMVFCEDINAGSSKAGADALGTSQIETSL